MAHLSDMTGPVAMKVSNSEGWSAASLNVPIRQGAEIWAKSGSRSEVQFDDGSDMRLGGNGLAVMETMYSDSNGEFTEIKLEDGLATFHLRSKASEYQVDAPDCSVKAYGPAIVRIGVNGGKSEVTVQQGEAQVICAKCNQALKAGQCMDLGTSVKGTEAVRPAPRQDSWDKWSSERDNVEFHQNKYVPDDINLNAGNLDSYGSWHNDPKYGEVWAPTESADWRPYSDGSWTWCSPMGWTWVGAEPWGWAPYHYGTWVHEPYGWGWSPGPAYQYWSPAVVDFSDDGVNVAWAPLAPWEVRYPAAFSIGFGGPNWGLSFSIGAVGCYYPGGEGFCVARPWATPYVNAGFGFYDPGYINGYYGATVGFSAGFYGASRFHPYYASHYGGATYASHSAFANGGTFNRLDSAHQSIFTHGRSFTGVPNRGSQLSGPLGVRPNSRSFAPSHRPASSTPPANLASRSTYRAPVRGNIARQSSLNNTRVASRDTARTAVSRVAASAAGNRYNRFNAVSKSPLTHSAVTETRNGLSRTAAAAGVAGRRTGRATSRSASHTPSTAAHGTAKTARRSSGSRHTVRPTSRATTRATTAKRMETSARRAAPVRRTASKRRAAPARRNSAAHSVGRSNGFHAPRNTSRPSIIRISSGFGGGNHAAPRSFGAGGFGRPAPRSFGGGAGRSFGGGSHSFGGGHSAPRGGGGRKPHGG
jgi:hypothetical protein